ncbi:hypothetical protein [Streptomyces zaomyceticus]|uniref:hypothetical protein n=1 Tax=Streptomyces zaomyceticus TaxID=68286 RepID=UPI0033AB8E44
MRPGSHARGGHAPHGNPFGVSFHPDELGAGLLADVLTTDLPLLGYPRALR